jgi:hypothetical protein
MMAQVFDNVQKELRWESVDGWRHSGKDTIGTTRAWKSRWKLVAVQAKVKWLPGLSSEAPLSVLG